MMMQMMREGSLSCLIYLGGRVTSRFEWRVLVVYGY
jgi:hypothetical protein